MKQAAEKSEVPKGFIPCRAFRHEPRHMTDAVTGGLLGVIVEFVRTTQCNVCKTVIHTTYSVPDFRVSKRQYLYPDNYRVKGGYPVFDARADYLKSRYPR